jgi:hypothetical protein
MVLITLYSDSKSLQCIGIVDMVQLCCSCEDCFLMKFTYNEFLQIPINYVHTANHYLYEHGGIDNATTGLLIVVW